MRMLKRNKRPFWYANVTGSGPEVNADGEHTGGWDHEYDATPTRAFGNISAARGVSSEQPFGELLEYDRSILVEDPDIPIDEQTILWIDTADVTGPHDYIVKRVARGLASAAIAVKKVNVRA
jgi:hypothetical protein